MENNLFLYRKMAKLRQLDIARVLDMTEQSVSNIETGRVKVSVDRAIQIGKILNVDHKKIFPSLFKK